MGKKKVSFLFVADAQRPIGMRFGVNFINVFMRSFYAHRSQKRKKLLELTIVFALLGFAFVTKAARKMLVKKSLGAVGKVDDARRQMES